MHLDQDIYFQLDFNKLYCNNNQELFQFEFKQGQYVFSNISIKRKIEWVGSQNISKLGLYDLETPYGYGGFIYNTKNQDFLREAFLAYRKYCNEHGIVTEFIRFHPFNDIHRHVESYLDFFVIDRKVAVVDLCLTQERRWAQYSSNTRNLLRKGKKSGLIVQPSSNLELFKRMYGQTMKRNNALEFYFFSDSYFNDLYEMDNVMLFEVRLDSEILAMSFMLLGETISHYHLSSNTQLGLKYNANLILLDEMFNYSKTLGKKYFLLGGGRTSDSNDQLFKFKSKFTKSFYDFNIAGVIFNNEAYNELNAIWENQFLGNDSMHFQKYRLNK